MLKPKEGNPVNNPTMIWLQSLVAPGAAKANSARFKILMIEMLHFGIGD